MAINRARNTVENKIRFKPTQAIAHARKESNFNAIPTAEKDSGDSITLLRLRNDEAVESVLAAAATHSQTAILG